MSGPAESELKPDLCEIWGVWRPSREQVLDFSNEGVLLIQICVLHVWESVYVSLDAEEPSTVSQYRKGM